MIELPKNPKAEDLVPFFRQLDERVSALEAYVIRNADRIGALETYAAQVVTERGKQIDDLRANAEQRQAEVNELRWAIGRGRRTTRR